MKLMGIDLGGINIATAVVDEKGAILAKHSQPTPRGVEPERVADAMAQAVRAAADKAGLALEEIACVGVGAPGTIEPEEGVVEYWSNLDFNHVPLVRYLTGRLGRPVCIENDANVAALGEYAAGAGKGCRSMLAITLGTGVGGGAILDGKLYTGFNYAGMEVGHFVVEHGGRPCTCGRLGCFEAYCSATALIKRTRLEMQACPDSLLWQEAGGDLDRVEGRTAFQALARGDAAAKRVVDEYAAYLGDGITSLVNILQPEIVCLGGGVAGAGRVLLDPVQAILDREDYARQNKRRTRLMPARLGNDAGLIGAALLPLFR